MDAKSIQDYLFQRIREKLEPNASLADTIAGLLYVSSDSAYRRIRGETPLVLEEARVLCEAFGISLDELMQAKKNSVSFTYTEVNNHDNSFHKYLQDILDNLNLLRAARQKEIIYLSKDIPVFYNFLFRPLFSFRYFFWMKSILQHPDFVSVRFSEGMLPCEIEDMGKEINRAYNEIPSTEIWNTECVNSTIAQVEYYREAGYFQSEEDIERIYDSLRCLIEHIRTQADAGGKFLPGENPGARPANYNFFHNRVVLGDNTIMVLAEGRKMLYLSYDVLNYMITQDESFCNNVYSKIQTLVRKATILSAVSEKQRNIFFNLLVRKIPDRVTLAGTNSQK